MCLVICNKTTKHNMILLFDSEKSLLILKLKRIYPFLDFLYSVGVFPVMDLNAVLNGEIEL